MAINRRKKLEQPQLLYVDADTLLMNLFARGFEEVTFRQLHDVDMMFRQTMGGVYVDLPAVREQPIKQPNLFTLTENGITRGKWSSAKKLMETSVSEWDVPDECKTVILESLMGYSGFMDVCCVRYFSMKYVEEQYNQRIPEEHREIFQSIMNRFCEENLPKGGS